jgi:hypothetical protein
MEIKINRKYTRSVNIERDLSSSEAASGYIQTSCGLETFKRFTQTISEDDTPRSWALVGPYGTGKSSFGLFLLTVTGNSKHSETIAARQSLRSSDKEIAKSFSNKVRGTKGFLKIVLTGKPQPFIKSFVGALKAGVERFWSRRPSFYKTLCNFGDMPKTSEVIDVLRQIQQHLETNLTKPTGILIIIDELGKLLEYEARHNDSEGMYLLQEIAEQAYKGSSANIYLFTLSHQSFEQYATSLSKRQKDEWAKIQGRFENIPYIEPIEQTLKIVAHAIVAQGQIPRSISKLIDRTVSVLSDMQALPHGFGKEKAVDLFNRCYPLHPSTALLLPLLCHKMAQNERTLFSFIGSEEPFGFKDCLRRTEEDGLIYPSALFNYFITNQSSSILDHFTYRKWAEVISAIERLGDAPDSDTTLLKTIGIINIIGAHGGLKASEKLLQEASGLLEDDFKKSLHRLLGRSLIQFRKFNNEFRVWQGSDFDLDKALEDEIEQIKGTDHVASLNSRSILPPVVATRHSITSGTFRSFNCICVTKSNLAGISKTICPRIVYCFKNPSDTLNDFLTNFDSDFDVIAISDGHEELSNAILQVIALDRIGDTHQELKSDPIALREHKDRLLAAREVEEKIIRKLSTNPEKLKWFWRQRELKIIRKADLSLQLSRILDEVFHASPIIKNELINRDNPSVQGISGRNKLLLAMLEHSNREDLGIDRYPAEKAIYKAVLLATGLHRHKDNCLTFASPPEAHPYKMHSAWIKIKEFIESTANNPMPFTDLDRELMAPPYGIKAGVLPILYTAAYVVHKHELALYEDNKYIPVLPPERYEVFVKRLDLFSIQLFRVEGARATLLEMYQELFRTQQEGGLIAIAQPLASFFENLPAYTRNTQTISNLAHKIRSAFYLAKSPHDLFFYHLPQACGTTPLELNRDDLNTYLITLRKGLKELAEVFPKLLETLFYDLANFFESESNNLKTLRDTLKSRSNTVKFVLPETGDLVTFVRYLQTSKGSDEEWIKRVFGFLAERRCELWSDEDLGKARNRLSQYVINFVDLEKVAMSHKKRACNSDNSFLIRVVHKGQIYDDLVHIETYEEAEVNALAKTLLNSISKYKSSKTKLAAIAKVTEKIFEAK